MVVFVRVPSWVEQRAAHPENVMAQLDLGYAISVLNRQGVTCELLDVEAEGGDLDRARTRLARLQPRVLVLHAITPAIPAALSLARWARERLPSLEQIIAVGQHATVLPETLLEEGSPVDVCLRGEYELQLARVVQDPGFQGAGVARRAAAGLVVDPTVLEIEDLDALPMPAHHLFVGPRYKVFHPTGVARRWRWGFVMSSRGCPFGCVYCSPTLRGSYGTRLRVRSTEGVLRELDYLRSLGATLVQFRDDVFTLDRGRTLDLCREMTRRRMPLRWTAQTRPDLVDPELLQAMRRAGCASIYFGVESGSWRSLQTLNKASTPQDARRAFAWARQARLFTVAFFMLGNPDETEAEIRQTYDLMMELRPDMIQVAFFTPYPGAPVFDRDLLRAYPLKSFSHYNFPINPSRVDEQRLRAWQRRFYLDFILRSGFLWRYLRHQSLPGLINPEKVLELARLGAHALLRRGPA